MKTIVEAAHAYTNKPVGLEEELGAKWGSLIATYLGSDAEKWLFVDDYNPKFSDKPETFNEKEYVALLGSFGFHPDKILYESKLVEKAKDVIDFLIKKEHAYFHNGNVLLSKNNKKLFDGAKDKYTCTLLDACLYLDKLEKSDSCVTVLDESYSKQQKDTLTILQVLGKDTNRIKLFFYSTKSKLFFPIESAELPIYAV